MPRQVIEDVLELVDVASLGQCPIAKRLADGTLNTSASIGNEEPRSLHDQSTVDQIPKQRHTHL